MDTPITELHLSPPGFREVPYSDMSGELARAKAMSDLILMVGTPFLMQTAREVFDGDNEASCNYATFAANVAHKVRGFPVAVWWQILTGEEVTP
jgi:hypothetical protein